VRAGTTKLGFALAAGTAALSITASAAADERFAVGAFGGYLFGTSIEGTSATLTSRASIENAPSYGAIADVAIRRNAFVELSYTRAPTELSLRQSDGFDAKYDLLVQYLQLGGLLVYPAPGAKWLRPIFGGTLGASIYSADSNGFSYTEWRFSLMFEGGVEIQPIDHFGIRLQARLGATFLTDNSALFCASGAGCALAYSGTAILQPELAAGAYLAF
jgi:hypothetical protein